MTLHITTITPYHIITVSDRLIATASESKIGYRDLDNDLYKHLILITDDARMTISFAGFAGLKSSPNQTIEWLTEVISNTSRDGFHTIEKHLSNIAIAANDYIVQYKKKRVPAAALRLAIYACGWVGTKEYGEVQYCCVIDNYIDKWWTWTPKARSKFTMRVKHYGNAKFEDGSYIAFLGNDRLGLKQRALLKVLESYARKEDPQKIFESSVSVIRAAASMSNGSIGYNCSGIRNSKGDQGIQAFDSRETAEYDTIMPNTIISTSNISGYVANMKGKNK